jgi:hypothetical protein
MLRGEGLGVRTKRERKRWQRERRTDDTAKDGMLSIEELGWGGGDEELASDRPCETTAASQLDAGHARKNRCFARRVGGETEEDHGPVRIRSRVGLQVSRVRKIPDQCLTKDVLQIWEGKAIPASLPLREAQVQCACTRNSHPSQ